MSNQFSARVIVSYGRTAIVAKINATEANYQQAKIRKQLGIIVCNDLVTVEQLAAQELVIVAVLKRQTVLARPDKQYQMKPFAANIDQILVVAAHAPGLDFYLIDSYLLNAQLLGIAAQLVFNKADLAHDKLQLAAKIEYYRSIGICCLSISLLENYNLKPLEQTLAHKTSIFVGQSGVGKSALVNHFIGQEKAKVGKLCAHSGLGAHTTSSTILYQLPNGGNLLDSPGVRSFATWQLSTAQIKTGFVEFAAYAKNCKFHNCLHRKEPACAVKLAVAEEKIAPWRYRHYLNMLDKSTE